MVLKERYLQTSPPFIFICTQLMQFMRRFLEACWEHVALHLIRVMDQKMKVKIILEENQVAISQVLSQADFIFFQFCDVAKLAVSHKMI